MTSKIEMMKDGQNKDWNHPEVIRHTIKYLRDGGNFIDIPCPYTPPELISEMIKKIKKASTSMQDKNSENDDIIEKKVLVLYTIEMALAMKEAKYNYVTVTTEKKCELTKHLASEIECDYMLLSEVEESDMKFDVVMGNPPFQAAKDGDRSLWARFIKRGNEVLDDGGILAMVVPHGWKSPTADIRKGSVCVFRDILTHQNTIYLNIDPNLGKQYFPKIGQIFTWFLTQNMKYGGETVIDIGNQSSMKVDISGMKLMPKRVTRESLSIVKKLTSFDRTWNFKRIIMKPKEWEDVLFEKTKSHPFGRINGNSNHLEKVVYTRIQCLHQNERKVFIPYNGSRYKLIVDNGEMGLTNGYYIVLEKDQRIDVAKTYFGSIIFQWLGSNKYTQYNEAAVINSVGAMPLSKSLTEKDIIDFYGITNNEMSYIEGTMKAMDE